ncbi:hypothetical protein [Mycolicibacterium llatzerense]|nr:hypothetical protein [Mycolicibacterium llatzerense]
MAKKPPKEVTGLAAVRAIATIYRLRFPTMARNPIHMVDKRSLRPT